MNSLSAALQPLVTRQREEEKARRIALFTSMRDDWRTALLRSTARRNELRAEFLRAGLGFFIGRVGFIPAKKAIQIEEYNRAMTLVERARKQALTEVDFYFDKLQREGVNL